MALTEPEAKTLGALSTLDRSQALTIQQLCRTTKLAETSLRDALLRLSRTGLAMRLPQGPARWQSTDRGRRTSRMPVYAEYARTDR